MLWRLLCAFTSQETATIWQSDNRPDSGGQFKWGDSAKVKDGRFDTPERICSALSYLPCDILEFFSVPDTSDAYS